MYDPENLMFFLFSMYDPILRGFKDILTFTLTLGKMAHVFQLGKTCV